MAHPEAQEAIAADTPTGDPLDDILKFIPEDEDKQPPEEPKDEDEDLDPEDEGDEPEAEETDEDSEDEPEAPAIEPPVSLNKDQKAAFAQLPAELQKVWAETEAQRNRDVQIKTTEAAEAKRSAFSQAQAELAQIAQQYASELEIYAQAFRPQEPDPALLSYDPAAYAQQVAYAKQQQTHYDELMGRVYATRQQSSHIDQQAQQQQIQVELQKLTQAWPEWNDPAKRTELAQSLTATASELGYTPERIGAADAQDLLVLRQVSDWKGKAAQWDAFQSRKMANVRAAKELPRVAKPGTTPSRNPSKAARADAAFQRAKTSKSGADYADFLEATGISL